MVEVKSTKIKYRRSNKKKYSKVEALNNAQKIAFAPFTFQAVAAMLDFGILKFLFEKEQLLRPAIKMKRHSKRFSCIQILIT